MIFLWFLVLLVFYIGWVISFINRVNTNTDKKGIMTGIIMSFLFAMLFGALLVKANELSSTLMVVGIYMFMSTFGFFIGLLQDYIKLKRRLKNQFFERLS